MNEESLKRIHNRVDVLAEDVAVLKSQVADLRKHLGKVDEEHSVTKALLVELRTDVKYIRQMLSDRGGRPDWTKWVATLIAVVATGALALLELIRRLG